MANSRIVTQLRSIASSMQDQVGLGDGLHDTISIVAEDLLETNGCFSQSLCFLADCLDRSLKAFDDLATELHVMANTIEGEEHALTSI